MSEAKVSTYPMSSSLIPSKARALASSYNGYELNQTSFCDTVIVLFKDFFFLRESFYEGTLPVDRADAPVFIQEKGGDLKWIYFFRIW